MEITYDKLVDAMYITLKETKIVGTICVNDFVNVDVDEKGETVGIELLFVSSQNVLGLEKGILKGIPIQLISNTLATV